MVVKTSLDWLENISNQELDSESFEDLYWESTKQTLVGLYSKRVNGEPVETVTEIVTRVSQSVALAELRYLSSPEEILALSLEEALQNPVVCWWANTFRKCIGRQYFWANTPGSINSDPEISLKVLKYEAYGKLAGMTTQEIWGKTEKLVFDSEEIFDSTDSRFYQYKMAELARELRGKGCLAACGVTYVEDSLQSIQEAARVEVLAAKNAMGMGINTSAIRPWASLVSNGAAASGPDRFYHKVISMAVESVAQGGRRGGALIELRNSDHPDILFFIEKKKLLPEPDFTQILDEELKKVDSNALPYYERVDAIQKAVQKHAELHHQYMDRQNYLKNTNVTVLAMPGFMEAVQNQEFYPTSWAGETWNKQVFDPRKPILDEKGLQKVSQLTKEPLFEEYRIELSKYPEAFNAAKKVVRQHPHTLFTTKENSVTVRGWLYAPEVFDRICEGMRDSGEPGIAFYNYVNRANANTHEYDLNTCNPCGEQFLPSGPSKKDKNRVYMGTCNLSSLHAAHSDFWDQNGGYDFSAMREITKFQQHFMDNVTDVSWYPLPAQNLTTRLERRNGGGFAGIAEYLSRSGVEFGSLASNQRVTELFKEYSRASLEASQELAIRRGVYEIWEGSEFEKLGLRVRNSCMVNNAPTGTLAQAMQTSWGVDPHNGIVFSRKVRSRYVDFVAPGFKDMMEFYGAWPETEEAQNTLIQKIRANNKSCRGIEGIPAQVQNAFPIRVEVSPEAYIRHLGSCFDGAVEFPHVFNSISNTCSIPKNMPLEQVREAVLLGYELGVKDLTFYPDGSRLSQPVEQIAAEEQKTNKDLLKLLGVRLQRVVDTNTTSGVTYKVKVGNATGDMGTLHVTLNKDPQSWGPVEIYTHLGKSGCFEGGMLEAVGRLASSFLQYAAQFGEEERNLVEETIIKQLSGIESGTVAWHTFPGEKKAQRILSPVDGVAKALKFHKNLCSVGKVKSEEVQESEEDKSSEITLKTSGKRVRCSKCSSQEVIKVDGCLNCLDCGYSRCG